MDAYMYLYLYNIFMLLFYAFYYAFIYQKIDKNNSFYYIRFVAKQTIFNLFFFYSIFL